MVARKAYARIMEILGACILGIILVAGLWPFHAPKNQVRWLENEHGLGFGRFASVLSSGAFHGKALDDDSSGSLEIWLEPRFPGSSRTILSFEGSGESGVPFSLHQYKDALVVNQCYDSNRSMARTTGFGVDRVFRDKKPVFVTITLGTQHTSVYVDGVLARTVPTLGVSTNNFSGRLVVGNSSSVNDSWSGVIRGLAIYGRQLSSAQVAQHYESWSRSFRPALTQDESPVALYLFKEGQGTVVQNEIDPATSLTIPERYLVLHQEFLSPPQREYHPTRGYWEDVAVNIAGFVPLGLWATAYFSSVRVVKWPAVLATFMGFSISLTIEVLQAFLPTRSSGMTDIITNTFGTVIGVALCQWSFIQGWLMTTRQSCNQVTTTPALEMALSDRS